MGKLSYDDKLRIQTFREQGFGAKSIIRSYPDHKGWKLSFVKKSAVESTPLTNNVISIKLKLCREATSEDVMRWSARYRGA